MILPYVWTVSTSYYFTDWITYVTKNQQKLKPERLYCYPVRWIGVNVCWTYCSPVVLPNLGMWTGWAQTRKHARIFPGLPGPQPAFFSLHVWKLQYFFKKNKKNREFSFLKRILKNYIQCKLSKQNLTIKGFFGSISVLNSKEKKCKEEPARPSFSPSPHVKSPTRPEPAFSRLVYIPIPISFDGFQQCCNRAFLMPFSEKLGFFETWGIFLC